MEVVVCCSEHSIVAARASVMVYDDGNKKWLPSGSSQGLSKVHIYHHSVNNTFRVVGRKLQDHEVCRHCHLVVCIHIFVESPFWCCDCPQQGLSDTLVDVLVSLFWTLDITFWLPICQIYWPKSTILIQVLNQMTFTLYMFQIQTIQDHCQQYLQR